MHRPIGTLGKPSLATTASDTRNYWWVNQRQNFEAEARWGLLRAPLRDHECYVNVGRLRPGDIVVHHVAGLMKAVGVVRSNPVEIRDPLGIESGQIRVANVTYYHLNKPVEVAALPEAWKLGERSRDSLVVAAHTLKRRPFHGRGVAIQAYLFGLSKNFVRHLLDTPEFAEAFNGFKGAQNALKEAC